MADKLLFVRVSDSAVPPKRASNGAAGYDLCASHYVEIQAGSRALVPTGLKLRIPEGHYGRVAPRSGLSVTQGLDVGAGVIDSDYRGEVFVLLFNHGNHHVLISPGQRVAQLVIQKISLPEVQEVDTLDDTERGEGGFGSTGV
ncbi:E4 ORFA [Bovine mastadenovirus A]|uniref:E4 ORFA n=1 Tax=Bovine mastadenovirus A TaxID=129953 RepID=UPI0000443FA0|nr:E4 ORFA [Bovine mastadenovirus A]